MFHVGNFDVVLNIPHVFHVGNFDVVLSITYSIGPGQTLIWHRRYLVCRQQARIFPACMSMWPLKKSWKVSEIGPAMA